MDNSGGCRPCVLLTDRLLLQANTAHAHLQSIYMKATESYSVSSLCSPHMGDSNYIVTLYPLLRVCDNILLLFATLYYFHPNIHKLGLVLGRGLRYLYWQQYTPCVRRYLFSPFSSVFYSEKVSLVYDNWC